MRTSAVPFRLSPSIVARYFFHDCERFLYFHAADASLRRKEGIPTPEFEHSPLVTSILHSGHQWEAEVVRRLLRGRVVVAPGTGDLHARRLSTAETRRRLEREKPGRFLYQPTLIPPPSFYEKHGIDRKRVLFNENHPDLVAIEGTAGQRRLRIIDVKRGAALRLTHRVQILLYALQLQAILEANGIDDAQVDLNQGGVWLGGQETPQEFDLAAFRPHLERFLRQDLEQILGGSAESVHWHLQPRCEWCEFFPHCQGEMRQCNDLSRLGGLTTGGKRHLVEAAGVATLPQLSRFLKRPEADNVLEQCASLAGQRHRLQVQTAALTDGQVHAYGAVSPDLPRGENIGVFLTLQREPLGQAIYLAGLHVTARAETRAMVLDGTPLAEVRPLVWLAERPEDEGKVRRDFLLALAELLERVDCHNAARREWKEQLSLQVYVYTREERDLLHELLIDALKNPDLAETATLLLFHFQGPELLHAEQHPDEEVAYPIVVLLEAVQRLLALPVEVSYTLPEMLQALESSFSYPRRDYYHFPLGQGLRAEAVHAAWHRGQAENLREIETQAAAYLRAVVALLHGVREHAPEGLVAWPPRFRLPRGTGVRDRLLSRLIFFARYESLLRCLTLRASRSEARLLQALRGQLLELEAHSPTRMAVRGNLVVTPSATGFPEWLLVRADDDGWRAQVEYADYPYRNQFHGGPEHAHRAIVGIEQLQTVAGTTMLDLKITRPFKGAAPRRGELFVLVPRFIDFTTDPVLRYLTALDGSPNLFLDLLRTPEQVAQPLPLPPDVSRQLPATPDFTPSQAAAYETVLAQRVTAVWGPPGTGKTWFLAATILALAAAHRQAQRPFRVLVSAFTHAAIENVLRKLRDLLPQDGPELAKAKQWQGAPPAVEVVSEAELPEWLADREQAVVGATVYSCLKFLEEAGPFDLVVIDEASQVRVPEAAVAINAVAPAGRLILAGDHLQLPPIITGTYPNPTAPERPLHRSIFEAVCPAVPASQPLRRQLLENFRMNDVLTSSAARLLYGRDYRCGSAAIARRRLTAPLPKDLDPLSAACLDPEYPLVLVLLHGLHTARANPIEADLVAQLVTTLRAHLQGADGKRYRDDAAFFRNGVFVVSPHHAQIRAIQQELAKQRQWGAAPFVDTVDKMQGQEADAVIVSYGVSDPEFAEREAEFIYGINRLNVALTRARSKCIVCLPQPLLDATPQVLDSEDAAAGLAFMRRLVAAAEAHGEVLAFEGDEVEARVIRLRSPLPPEEPGG